MKQTPITFPCGDILLEGVWHLPETNKLTPAVIVCHPHPLHGGSMSNNVVFAICETLAQRAIAALRFNFRGVGRSGGEYGGGISEQEDARAALTLASSTTGTDRQMIGLAGYSFGGSIALSTAAENGAVNLLALVSPALSDAGWEQLKAYSRPVLLISGEYDPVVPPEQVQQYAKQTIDLKRIEIIPGVDHLWQGYEAELAQKVTGFFFTGFSRLQVG